MKNNKIKLLFSRWRAERGLTLQAIAKLTGLNYTSAWKACNGLPVNVITLYKIMQLEPDQQRRERFLADYFKILGEIQSSPPK